MPRVHFVKKARKDNSAVKKGESYYWWKPYRSYKHCSSIRPTRSQLTQSAFLSQLYNLEDGMAKEYNQDEAETLVEKLEELVGMCEDSLSNMPEPLQDSSDSGMLLQDRIDCLYEWTEAIYNIDWDSITPEEAATLIADANPF